MGTPDSGIYELKYIAVYIGVLDHCTTECNVVAKLIVFELRLVVYLYALWSLVISFVTTLIRAIFVCLCSILLIQHELKFLSHASLASIYIFMLLACLICLVGYRLLLLF
jgi:hypothetical protein